MVVVAPDCVAVTPAPTKFKLSTPAESSAPSSYEVTRAGKQFASVGPQAPAPAPGSSVSPTAKGIARGAACAKEADDINAKRATAIVIAESR